MVAEEKYESKILVIESKNMSDGMLRLLAFLAICEMDKKGIMLLDEIENGTNLDYAEKIINILEENCQNN
ncbi:MAG: ATP-binding protein [Lachnospiraceae bacterium]